MNIKIILKQPYPHGMACTNRIHHYARGLQEEGHQVEIIVPIPLESQQEVKNHQVTGIHEGVHFTYASGSTYRSKRFLQRRINDILGPLKAAYRVYTSKQPDATILVSNYLYHIILFKLISWLVGATYIQEKSELPFAFSQADDALSKVLQRIHNRIIYQSFDGIFVISEQLHTFFTPLIRKSARLLLVPIIVNLEEFALRNSTPTSERYIAYTGNLSDHKDGITTLITAFHRVIAQYPDIRLYLIGKPTVQAQEVVNKLLSKYQLQSSVILTGYVSREKLVTYLAGADMLVLAKPDNLQANFCFPSKLGEYLATGKPVVTTRVGEIPTYLQDGKTAFLAEANSAPAFADKIIQVLKHSQEARRVGEQGRNLALQEFSYQQQGKRIASFIQDLSNHHKSSVHL